MGTKPSRTRLASCSAEPRLTLYLLMLANMVLPSLGLSGNRCHCLSARQCNIACPFLTEKQRVRNTDSWKSACRGRRHPPDLAHLGGTHLQQPRSLAHTATFIQRSADAIDLERRRPWPAKALAGRSSALQSGHHPIPDHRSLELGEHPQHPEQHPAGWRTGIEGLLVQVEIDVAGS
jgi:hypothetical protein